MTSASFSDADIIQRYTDQPARLPAEIRARVDSTIEFYALADLDARFSADRTWVVLGKDQLSSVHESSGPDAVRAVPRSQIRALVVSPGLSCQTLRVYAVGSEAPVLDVRFTNRQRRSFENLVFMLEQAIAGRSVVPGDADTLYAECVARPIREAQALVSKGHLSVVWRLLGYLRPYRKKVLLGMTAAAGVTLLSLVPPYITGYLIDRVIRPAQSGSIELAQASRAAWYSVTGLAVAYALGQLCLWIRLRLMATLGEAVASDLRNELYAHLQELSVSFFSRKKTGSLITRVSSDTDRLWEFLAFGVVEVTLALLMLLGLSGVLLSLDWRLGLVMVLPVPLFCWAIHVHGNGMNQLFLRAWRKWSRLTDVLSDTIPGVRVVKAFNQQAREQRRFGQRNAEALHEFNRIHTAWTGFWPRILLAVQATVVCVWALALPRLISAHSAVGPAMSLGVFVSFLLYTTMFVHPIDIIGQVARIMHRATSSAHRVFEVLDTEPELIERPDAIRLERVEGSVRFDNVSFAYDGVRHVLKGISFDVKAGELIGLVGPSGGGKTTLMNLLTRFYDVSGGRILVDGVDLRDLHAGTYREQVGMVLQDPYLFHGTILENIRYGMPEAKLSDAIAAARAANAHDFICKMPHAYDTIVGERGHTLSGGERQRVSIARAILKNPRLLILDEATSSVDTETERKIQDALDRLVAGRTVFAIAHRLSTLRRASRLFVIEDGKLAECGTHDELLALPNGTYRKLFLLQQELHVAA